MERVEIEIVNWGKHQTSTDSVRHPRWFKVNNDIATNDALFGLSASTKWLWICLLAHVSKNIRSCHRGDTELARSCHVDATHFTRTCNIRRTDFKRGLTELQARKCIKIVQWTDSRVSDRLDKKRRDKKRGDLSEGATSIPPTAVSPASQVETRTPARDLIVEFIKAYEGRYKTRPVIDGRTQGLVKQVLKAVPLERAKLLVQCYLQLEEPWFKTKAHDFVTFYENLTKISTSLDAGKLVGTDAGPREKDWREIVRERENDRRSIRETNTKTLVAVEK